MYEIRKDIITGKWVLIATDRVDRPYEYERKIEFIHKQHECSFCPGNEHLTPQSADAFEPDWTFRAFPNMFPAVSCEETYGYENGFYEKVNGCGIHEVIVDTNNHNENIWDFSAKHMTEVLLAIQRKQVEIEHKPFIKYVHIFKNCGMNAGASIRHSHLQVLGLPIIPQRQYEIIAANKSYKKHHHSCLFCDMVKHEQNEQARFIEDNGDFIAFCPYASMFSYETWIVSKEHIESLVDMTGEQMAVLAKTLLNAVRRLRVIMPDSAFNICFISAVTQKEKRKLNHFHVMITPRFGTLAGFEIGTDSHITVISPEDAAYNLRKLSLT